jgi:CheY-like chemotaxis protein
VSDKPYVLVVDDDEVTREMVVSAMEESCRMAAAASGEDALRALAEGLPDVVLLDIEMDPGIDGYETCRRIKANDATSAVPVIFVSGRDRIEDRLKGYEAGGDDYIVKPFDPQELEAKLIRLFETIAERASLKQMAQYAGSTAMTAMTSMGEMGSLLEAMKSFGTCVDYRGLADAMLAGLALYGLRGTAQIRSGDSVLTRDAGGEASALEASIIAHMASMERITQFKSRMSITYKRVSLLVHNMPTEDPDRCGRLRDHLAMLAEGADARAEAIAATAESQRRGSTINRAVARITATLSDIDRAQREQQVATRLAVENITDRMQLAYVSVAMTTAQEDFMNETLHAGLNQLLDSHTDVSGLQDQLSSIVKELKEMSGSGDGGH